MRRIAALVVLLAAVLVFGVAQLMLPGIAAQRIRTRLSAYGSVRSVRVDAFPAIELLWHHAQTIHIDLAGYRSGSAQVGSLLAQLAGVDSLDVSADQLDIGLLRLRDATLRKRGSALHAAARVTEADLRAAVPFLDRVVPVTSRNGVLVLEGAATVLGVTASARATVGVADGALIVSPDVPFGALGTVTLFSDPRVAVQGVGAATAPGGFTVSARAVLR
jgi:hypothetical protein